jgi:hypothetical protein
LQGFFEVELEGEEPKPAPPIATQGLLFGGM